MPSPRFSVIQALAAVALGLHAAQAALFVSPTSEVLSKSYDVIVVGAGAAGAVMANRLTEDPDTTVLLIEAGSDDFMNLNISVPGFASRLTGSQFDWNFTTTPQEGLNNRAIQYPRGFVLGGSTAINLMAFCRGTKDDFGRIANVTGDSGWEWENLLPFVLKVDNITAPADGHNTTGQYNPAVHRHAADLGLGVVDISVPGMFLEPIDSIALNTSAELPDEFPFNLDYNSGDTIGFSWAQWTIHDGVRVTSASSYLAQASSRTNLDILVNTRVTKILPVGSCADTPDMRTVEFAQSADGPTYNLTASKEVILSAGSIKTPHILMLSGIGDATHLSDKGITPIVNLTAVGRNLQDHVFLPNSWNVTANFTLDDLHRSANLTAEQLQLWMTNGTGFLGLPPSDQFMWLRANDSIFTDIDAEDPSAGPTSAHFEIIISDNFVSKRVALPSTGRFLSLITNVISPSSRGNITLNTTDPFDAPLINPALLSTDVDRAIMRAAIAAVRRFAAAPAFAGYLVGEFGAFGAARSADEIDAYAADNADTVDHPVGTVALGSALERDFRVKGTRGLRVVDASTFPFVPSAHTQGPTYIVAERAASLVKAGLRRA
ncbi:alcohol oxidase [Epithele typhae]|uniref:alcohol oxidase n=1 Tax=Epithele typhae TaxID=378194 RepID=UPI0020085119|nr:alcohol oxidase [Epithele typhae]KAH9921221.1 alcohol oxidase [Epithele typhae]